jgi:aminomethyltransferase
MEPKKTSLFDIHMKTGARMVPFAGYMMPLQYSSIIEEHNAVRKNAGIFDVSHMGEFMIEGDDAASLIQHVTSNDISQLANGQCQYSCLPNNIGGIVDDLLVYKFNDRKYMLVVNASNTEKDWNWIMDNNHQNAAMENISENITLLAVQGPKAVNLLQKITSVDLAGMKYYTFIRGNLGNITDGAIISATGYTGSGGFEIYVYNQFAEAAWNLIMDAGNEFGIKPVGLAARDTLRLEMGYCLYGNDIDDTTSPIEAGLGWITKFTKKFIHSEELLLQKKNGTSRRLVGFEMAEKGIPRHGYRILDQNGEEVGLVTSGTMSPSLGIGVGMGYLSSGLEKPGTEIYIEIREKKLKATVVKLPFYKSSPS